MRSLFPLVPYFPPSSCGPVKRLNIVTASARSACRRTRRCCCRTALWLACMRLAPRTIAVVTQPPAAHPGRPVLRCRSYFSLLRGTATGEAAEISAIRARLRYGEQTKGSAGEFRQARTNLNQSQDPFGPSPQPSSVHS